MVKSVVNILSRLHREEEGQGMIEYMLIIVFIALAATVGMGALASAINSAFTQIGSLLGNYIS